jgi:Flp pilus assembly protein TadB
MDDEKDACLKFMKEAEERRIADINSIEDSRNKLLQNYLDEMKRRRNVMESAEKTLRTLRVWRLLGVAAILFWVVFWMGWPW